MPPPSATRRDFDVEWELRRLLRNYVRRHRHTAAGIGCSLGDMVYGDCWVMSFELGQQMRKQFPREPIQMVFGKHILVPLGSQPALRHGGPEAVPDGPDIVQHYALHWRGLVLDPSTHQFGWPRTTYPVSLFRRRWQRVSFQSWRTVMRIARENGHI